MPINLRKRTYELQTFHLQPSPVGGSQKIVDVHKKIGVYSPDFRGRKGAESMVNKSNPKGKKKSGKGRTKTLNLKRESVKI